LACAGKVVRCVYRQTDPIGRFVNTNALKDMAKRKKEVRDLLL